MTIICKRSSSVHTKFINSAECMRARCTWCSQTFITGKCLWNGRALINPFLCMQSWNATFFFFFCYSLWGGGWGGFGSGSGSKFNCAARVGSGSGQTISGTGRVRASVLSPCRPLVCAHMCVREGEREKSVCVCVWEVTQTTACVLQIRVFFFHLMHMLTLFSS